MARTGTHRLTRPWVSSFHIESFFIRFFFPPNTHPSLYWILPKRKTGMSRTYTFLQSGVQKNTFQEGDEQTVMRAHRQIYMLHIRHAECATWFSNGMPRLGVCVRPHCSPLCCSPWLSGQFTATCSLSFFAF